MWKAVRLCGFRGPLQDWIEASELRSREDARKLGPFVEPEQRRWVHWRKASFTEQGGLTRRSHFAFYPNGANHDGSPPAGYDTPSLDLDLLVRTGGEGAKHRKAQSLIVAELDRLLRAGQSLMWSFRDDRNSYFSFAGDLLNGATRVAGNHRISTPFGKDYVVDIAILGPQIGSQPLVLGAVEVEDSHRFENLKSMMLKAMGFPLISIDISEVDEADITDSWAQHCLKETTLSDETHRRRNYVYLHDMLYPAFLRVPGTYFRDERHQYLIFSSNRDLANLEEWLKRARSRLKLSDAEVRIMRVNAPNAQAQRTMELEGAIAGSSWNQFGNTSYLRVIAPRPQDSNAPILFLHLILTRLVTCHANTLVAYKPGLRFSRDVDDDPRWHSDLLGAKGELELDDGHRPVPIPICLKCVSLPWKQMLAAAAQIVK